MSSQCLLPCCSLQRDDRASVCHVCRMSGSSSCPVLAGRALQLSDVPEERPGSVQGLVSVFGCLGGCAVPLHYWACLINYYFGI